MIVIVAEQLWMQNQAELMPDEMLIQRLLFVSSCYVYIHASKTEVKIVYFYIIQSLI